MMNHGKRWAKEDLAEMSAMYNKGMNIKVIADKLNRTETAIQSKIDVMLPITISDEVLESITKEVYHLLDKYTLDVRCLYLYLMKIKTKISGSGVNVMPSLMKSEQYNHDVVEYKILDDSLNEQIIEDVLIVDLPISANAGAGANAGANAGADLSISASAPFSASAPISASASAIAIASAIAPINASADLSISASATAPISAITSDNDNANASDNVSTLHLTECQERAIEYFKRKRSMCITGPAGTGKTFVLNYIKRYCIAEKINYGMTAMTGVAAALISGQTLHSWTGLGLINKEVGHMINTIKFRKHLFNKWTTVELLIIDEVSMMEIGLFETLNFIFQKVRGNNLFFGGVQMILCGDFAQLAPIRSSNYIFQSKLWIDNIADNTVYLNKIMRQDDPIFIKILSEIRLGIITDETKDILNSRIIKYDPSVDTNGIEPTQLFPHKATVAEINSTKLAELLKIHPRLEFISKDTVQNKSTKKTSSAKADQVKLLDDRISGTLVFAKSAQVMLKTNLDTSHGLVNGSRGIVLGAIVNGLSVLFDNGQTISICPCEFLIETTTDIIKRVQLPLELAWASTTHKAQGSTITKVITDMRDIFCDAQGYVTLSRVKSLEGLFLLGINYDKITCNEKVIKYYTNLERDDDDDVIGRY